jgi:hypothetical protein
LLPVASEPAVITLDFVDANGTVVDHKDFTVAAPPPNEHSPRARPWSMKTFVGRLAGLEDRFRFVQKAIGIRLTSRPGRVINRQGFGGNDKL